MQQPVQTVVIKPKAPLPQGLAEALVAADFRVVASASHVGDLGQISLSRNRPVLLIIYARNKTDDVVSQIKLFKEQYPLSRVAVLANHYGRNDLVSAYRTGANAYFTKAMSSGTFITTLELVMLGETILPPELLTFIRDPEDHQHTRMALHSADVRTPPGNDDEDLPSLGVGASDWRSLVTDVIPRLSAREKIILSCIVEGCSNKSIARKIDIAVATVKVHVKAILRKIRASNRTQAAIWAVNNSSLVWSTGNGAPPIGGTGNGGPRYFETAAGVEETRAFETTFNPEENGCVRNEKPSNAFENELYK